MVGDSAYDTLNWHDHLLDTEVVPVAPYNARNADDPKAIEDRGEDRIKKHSEDIHLKKSTLDETTAAQESNEKAVLSDQS